MCQSEKYPPDDFLLDFIRQHGCGFDEYDLQIILET